MTEQEYQDTNVVMIGIKPFMNYVTAVKMQFDKNERIIIMARGKFISKAFNVIEVCKRNFLNNLIIEYEKINVGSIPFIIKDSNKEIYVSEIEINLIKKEKENHGSNREF